MGVFIVARADRGGLARPRRLLQWLAGSLAGCPGLEEVSTEPDRARSGAPGSEGTAKGPLMAKGPLGDDTNEQRDLVSTRDRIGLGCVLFPGCGLGLVALMSIAIASVVALTPSAVGADVDTEPAGRFVRMDLPANLVANGALVDIGVSDAGWVMVGWEDAAGSPRPAVLHSTDGLTWHRSPLPDGLARGLLAHVEAHDGGFVATGMWGALWTSADGVTWQAHELEASLGSSYFHDITVHEGTLYAVGCVAMAEQSCSDIGIWRSDDFVTMEPLPLPDGMAFVPYAVTANDRGLVVAGFGGRSEDGEYSEQGFVSWTGDERSWETTSFGPDTRVVAVESGRDGFVAVGTRDGDVLAVSSPDGVTWSDIADSSPPGFATSVDPGPPVLLAGFETSDDGWHGPAMWRQEPGGGLGSLTLEGLEPGQQGEVRVLAVTAGGDVMALGSVHVGGAEEAALWRFAAERARASSPSGCISPTDVCHAPAGCSRILIRGSR
jgi:hypothetical protein